MNDSLKQPGKVLQDYSKDMFGVHEFLDVWKSDKIAALDYAKGMSDRDSYPGQYLNNLCLTGYLERQELDEAILKWFESHMEYGPYTYSFWSTYHELLCYVNYAPNAILSSWCVKNLIEQLIRVNFPGNFAFSIKVALINAVLSNSHTYHNKNVFVLEKALFHPLTSNVPAWQVTYVSPLKKLYFNYRVDSVDGAYWDWNSGVMWFLQKAAKQTIRVCKAGVITEYDVERIEKKLMEMLTEVFMPKKYLVVQSIFAAIKLGDYSTAKDLAETKARNWLENQGVLFALRSIHN